MAPSPSVFLAAVSQRTKKMRVGTLVYTLPIYHPYRLYEEICMLDQLSQGRLDLGIGRGASPVEMSFLSVDIKDADRMYAETLEILMQCFEGGRLTHHGEFYSFDDVPIEIEPFQKPRPPLWYGIGNPGRIPWAVENRVNLMTNYTAKHARELRDAFLKEWLTAGNGPDDLPLFGSSKHIIVAETDAQARKLADTAYRNVLESHHPSSPSEAEFPGCAPGSRMSMKHLLAEFYLPVRPQRCATDSRPTSVSREQTFSRFALPSVTSRTSNPSRP